MKSYFRYIIIVTLALLSFKTGLSQGEVVSVNPPSAFAGETLNLIVQGSGTDFTEGMTEIVFPESSLITTNEILVNSPELLTASIAIGKKSPAKLYKFEIITPAQKLLAHFEVTELSDEPEAMISVFPVQSIYLSDFDFSNLRNLPLLFTISVYSAGYEKITVVTELKHEKYGILASADKEINKPGKIFTFDNRQFDSYDTDKASDEVLELIMGGGGLIPPGQYTYYVHLYFGSEEKIIESGFYITNSVSGIDLIGPGTELDYDPEIIITNTPYFQWFGGLLDYNLTIYEVMEGQKSPDEITSNVPVFTIEKMSTSSFLYPAYAERLVEGEIYAWQVTSDMISTSSGSKVKSDVFWFIYKRGNKPEQSIDNIKVFPDDANIYPGDSIQIKVSGFNINDDSLQVECEWEIIPDNMGTINKNGWFVAGTKPGTVAVSAKCGSKEDYITINILDGRK
jgi:hypothetical protein